MEEILNTSASCQYILFSYPVYFLIAYLVGSIPFGLLLTKLFRTGDIRKIGSGNIGATNVLRTGNKALALATLILDAAKVAVLFVVFKFLGQCDASIPQYILLLMGLFGILGHCYPAWLKFKGGKGVATTLGVLLAAVPWAGLVACVTWGIVAGFFRISSLAALVAIAVVPIATLLIYGPMPAVVTILIALLVFWRHKENIQRLLKGEEPKIGQKKEEQK